LNEEILIEALEDATRAQLIQELPSGHSGNIRFTFVHALIPATLREGVSGIRRQRLHRRAATALQALRPAEYETIAAHLDQGSEPDQARSYYQKAGERALAVYANADAERDFRAALELDGTPAERASLTAGLAKALHQQSHLPESLQAWLEAADQYRLAQDEDGLAYAYAHAAILARIAGDTARASAIVQQGLSAVEGLPETSGYATLLGIQTYVRLATGGSYDEVYVLSLHALEVAQRVGNTEAQAEILNHIGFLLNFLNRFEEAKAAHAQAIQIAEAHDYWRAADVAHNYLGQLLVDLGDAENGLQHCQRAAEIAQRSGSIYDEIFNLGYMLGVRLYQGDIAAAQELNARVESLLKFIVTTGPAWQVSTIYRALLFHTQGNSEKGLAMLEEALEQAVSQGDQGYQVTAGGARGFVLFDLRRWEDAARALTQTKEVADTSFGGENLIDAMLAAACARLGRLDESRRLLVQAESKAGTSQSFQSRFMIGQARAHLAWAEGDWTTAWAAFEQIATLVEQTSFRWFLGYIWREWAESYLAHGGAEDISTARQILERALDLYQSCGMNAHAGRVQTRLDEIGNVYTGGL
jgi:tetratricopeptide (TPR) repeat protein